MRFSNEEMLEFAKLSSIAYGDLKSNINKDETNVFKNDEGKNIVLNKKYSIVDFVDKKSGLQAMCFKCEDGKYVISFRGTEFDKKEDKGTDINIGVRNINPQFKDAQMFIDKIVERIIKDNGGKISKEQAKELLSLTGHSLGGIHVQQAGMKNHIKGVAFNPYGANKLLNTSGPSEHCVTIGVGRFNKKHCVTRAKPLSDSSKNLAPSVDEKWAKENIYTISHVNDILSNGMTNKTSMHIGMVIPITNKEKVGVTQAHSINNAINVLEEYNDISKNCSVSYSDITKTRLDEINYKADNKKAIRQGRMPKYKDEFSCVNTSSIYSSHEGSVLKNK